MFGTKTKVHNRHQKTSHVLNTQNVSSCTCIDSQRAGSRARGTRASREKPRVLDLMMSALVGYVFLSLLCFSIVVKYYFQVSFNLTVILSMVKITQNTLNVLL